MSGPRAEALVVGTGRMAALRIPRLRAAGLRVSLTGRDPGRVSDVAAGLGAKPVSYREAMSTEYTCAVVASASEDHADDLGAVQAVAPIMLCEKPVATGVAEALKLLAASEEAGREIYVGFQRRFDPAVVALRQRVSSGELGSLLHVRASDFDHRVASRAFIAKSGGMFADLVIHDLDWLTWTTQTSISTVHAEGSVLVSSDYQDFGDCDVATVSMVMVGGTLATVNASRRHPGGQDVRMEIMGTGGAVSVGLTPQTPLEPQEGTTNVGSEPAAEDFSTRFADAFVRETDQFADYVLGRRDHYDGCTLQEAVAALAAARACELSWREGRTVSLAATDAGLG